MYIYNINVCAEVECFTSDVPEVSAWWFWFPGAVTGGVEECVWGGRGGSRKQSDSISCCRAGMSLVSRRSHHTGALFPLGTLANVDRVMWPRRRRRFQSPAIRAGDQRSAPSVTSSAAVWGSAAETTSRTNVVIDFSPKLLLLPSYCVMSQRALKGLLDVGSASLTTPVARSHLCSLCWWSFLLTPASRGQCGLRVDLFRSLSFAWTTAELTW